MNSNSVYNKLLELKGKEISLSEFQDLLESSNRRNTIFVQWETNEGNIDYYEMYLIEKNIFNKNNKLVTPFSHLKKEFYKIINITQLKEFIGN